MSWWQALPQHIDPIAFAIAGIPFPWYTVFYGAGVFCATLFLVSLLRRGSLIRSEDTVIELLVAVLWGVIIGARLGFILLYGDESYWREPWRIISPYDFSLGEWVGIRGLSFHGGLVGGAFGLWRFTQEAGRSFWAYADALIQAAPLGIFFGRLGNFFNHEIIGRPTDVVWGMYTLLGEAVLRHPVVLYEALGEGVALFFWLMLARRLRVRTGGISALFLVGYGVLRFFFEFFRDETQLMYGFLTMGQLLSLFMICGGTILFAWQVHRPRVVQ